MDLTIALCDACPSTEVDEMTISLLNIFDSRGLGFVLLEALIEHEVDETGKQCNRTDSYCPQALTLCRKRGRTSAAELRCNKDAICLRQMEGRIVSESDITAGIGASHVDVERP